jgi:large subunit ribosomal protein L15
MPLGLHNLKINKGAKKRKRNRVGRGNSSGHGNYSTRGLKGQRARSGGKGGLKRKGMKMILQRIPKYKGMKSPQQPKQIVNLNILEKYFNDGDVVEPKILFKKQFIGSMKRAVKILSNGELKKKLEIQAHQFSAKAKEAIEKAGGRVVILEFRRKGDVNKLKIQNPKFKESKVKKSNKN